MNRSIYKLVAIANIAVALSCSGTDPIEFNGSHSEALKAAGLAPVPSLYNTLIPSWSGSAVDLMMADTLVGCALQTEEKRISQDLEKEMGSEDAYLLELRKTMKASVCTDTPSVTLSLLEQWHWQRGEPKCNVDTGTGKNAAAPIRVQGKDELLTKVANLGRPFWRPHNNLCMAQRLRRAAPGTAGGEALILSMAEQRQLIEMTRERAQIAMLGYAQLGLFMEHDLAMAESIKEELGREFAAAVQLHVETSQEVAELLSRSGSARSDRGGGTRSLAADTWGPGSWRQRALSALYGGDPLTPEADGSSPWKHLVIHGPTAKPGHSVDPREGDWPSAAESPWVDVNISDPHVLLMLNLARHHNALWFPSAQSTVAEQSCSVVDAANGGDHLYRTLEGHLRRAELVDPARTVPGALTPTAEQLRAGYSTFRLWTRHQLTPAHAALLTRFIGQLIPVRCQTTRDGVATPQWREGPLDINGTIDTEAFGNQPGIRLSADVQFVPRPMQRVQPLYSRLTRYYTPSSENPMSDLKSRAPDGMRVMGSVAALMATRDAILKADVVSKRPTAGCAESKSFRSFNDGILGVIAGAIGGSGVSISPSIEETGNLQDQANDSPVWDVDVVLASDALSWWDAAHSASFKLLAYQDDGFTADLAMHPRSVIYGQGPLDLEAGNVMPTVTSTVTSITPFAFANDRMERWRFRVALPISTKPWTFVMRRSAPGGTIARPEVMLLAGKVPLRTGAKTTAFYHEDVTGYVPVSAHYIAFDGPFNRMGAQIIRVDPSNPTQPAVDGFGIPKGWVPPSEPSLIGASEGVNIVDHYLQRARSAAEDATGAVRLAFENLLVQQQAEAEVIASEARGRKVTELTRRALCGEGSAECDANPAVVTIGKDRLWQLHNNKPLTDPNHTLTGLTINCERKDATRDAAGRVDCLVSSIFNTIPISVTVPQALARHENDPTPPLFYEFEGGAIQSVLTRQWLALRRLRLELTELVAASASAQDRARAFEETIKTLDSRVQRNCSAEAMTQAVEAGHGTSTGTSTGTNESTTDGTSHSTTVGSSVSVGTSVGALGSVSMTMSYSESETHGTSHSTTTGTSKGTSTGDSFSDGPLIAQKMKCDELKLEVEPAKWQKISGFTDILVSLAAHEARLMEAVGALRETVAEGVRIQQDAKLSNERQALEEALLKDTQLTNFGLFRQYHSYDLWRAKALLENARRYAVVARRAIESQFLLDLSSMHSDEPFVKNPSSWADEIYEYDLSMPRAVGLSVGTSESGGIYANRVLDYVSNLENLVHGYAVSRPSSVARNETDVVVLPGFNSSAIPAALRHHDPSGTSGWSLFCPADDGGRWIPSPEGGDVASACGDKPPTRARMTFMLDAWGRVQGDPSAQPIKKRYNSRWERFFVNLIGSNVVNCERSLSPSKCKIEPYVRYDLSHAGPVWLTTFEQQWRHLGVPVGRVEQGKAVADDQLSSAQDSGWSRPDAQQIARTEWSGRPFGGSYQLEIALTPEVNIAQIRQVQLLLESRSWVRQD